MAEAKKTETGENIYQLINRISQEAGALAPEKTGGVPFSFRGIDAVVAHLTPLLNKYGVVVIPEVHEHNVSSAPSGNKVVTTSDVKTTYRFYAPDGTYVAATVAGLANDYADRSAAQAQSVAFRVALLQTFHLPTHSPEPEQTGVEPEAPKAVAKAPTPAREPADLGALKNTVKNLLEGKGLNTDAKKIAWGKENGLTPGWNGTVGGLEKAIDLIQKQG